MRKPTYLDTFRKELDGASPSTRLFTIRFCREFGIDKPIEMTQEALAKQMGLSLHITRTAIHHLKRYGHLSIESSAQLRGRPIYRYQLHPRHSLVKGGLPKTTPHHVLLIESLLSPGQHSLLKTPEKILLAVLLRYADQGGVVDNLGLPKLCVLTGSSEDRLRHYVRQLIQKGYLYTYHSGMTYRYLLGQCHSLYAITLKARHWEKQHMPRVKSVLFIKEHFPTRDPYNAAGFIYSYAKRPIKNWSLDFIDPHINEVTNFFMCDQATALEILPFFVDTPESWHFLQYRLECVIERLAQKSWQHDSEPEKYTAETQADIQSALFPKTLLSHKTDPRFPTYKQIQLLTDVFYRFVLDTTKIIVKTIKHSPLNIPSWKRGTLKLLPPRPQFDDVELLVLPE